MSTLSLHLLGPLQVTLDGKPVNDFVTRKAQALLVYLATTQTTHTRDKVAALFWPDLSEQNARNNLRRILPNLRQLVGEHLTITHQTLAFNRAASYWLDIESFSNTPIDTVGSETSTRSLEWLIAKTQLYGGEFLQGFHLPDVPAFEEWLLLEREHFRHQALRALTALAEQYLQTDDTAAGLATTKRMLELEPWYEAAHQCQMLLLAQNGQRAAALLQYETCRKLLADEFGAEPSAEMTAHYERIKAGDAAANERSRTPPAATPQATAPIERAPVLPTPPDAKPRLDGDDMPRPTGFYGRHADITVLSRRLLVEQKAVVALLGTGGTGKTALTVELVRVLAGQRESPTSTEQAESPFSHIIWRSLVNAPPLATIVRSWLQSLTGAPVDTLPTTLYEQLDLLFACLRAQRCLLVLDNLEGLLQEGEQAGHFRSDYAEYEQLLQRMGETAHRSCLLFTSRELPVVVGRLERSYPLVCSHMLPGLDVESGMRLLRAEGLRGSADGLCQLVARYSGIPLALKLVAETIQDFYGGDIAVLLQERTLVFDDMQTVLQQQFRRLPALEVEILCWLAIAREPVALQELTKQWDQPPPRRQFLEGVRSLQRRGLIEAVAAGADEMPGDGQRAISHDVRFTLQNVVMEYVSELLIEQLVCDLAETPLAAGRRVDQPVDQPVDHSIEQRWLNRYSLVNAQAKPYIREMQLRLLMQPLLRRLLHRWGQSFLMQQLSCRLVHLRREAVAATGYAGTNILHLLFQMNVDLRGWDFSRLSLRQADLRTTALAQVNLQGADLTDAAFISTIDIISTMALHPTGRYLAAGSSDGTIYLWRTADFQPDGVLRHHQQTVTALAFSPDGLHLVSSGLDGDICIWEVATNGLLRLLPNRGKSIEALALRSDNRHLAAATDDLIYLWDWQAAVVRLTLLAATTVMALAISPDGEQLIGVGDKQKIQIWNMQLTDQVLTVQGHAGKILAVAYAPQGDRFATGGEDGRILVWDGATTTPIHVLSGHTDFVLALAFRADGTQLASSSADQTVRIWDVETGKQLQLLRGHHGWVKAVTFFPHGRTLVSGGYDQTIRLWDTNSGQLQRLLKGYLHRVDFTSFSANGTLLAACGLDGTVRIWTVASAALWQTLQGPTAATRQVLFSRDQQLLATASDDYVVRLWDLARGRLRCALHGHTGPVRCLTFTPDERYLISGSHDQTLRIWEVATGLLLETIPNVSATIQAAIALSPTNHHLAFGTLDGTVQICDLHTSAPVQTLAIAPTTAVVLAFAPDGQQLACGTKDGQVLLYVLSAADGQYQLARRIHVTESPIWRLLFSPDATQLAWICAAQELYRFTLATGDMGEPIRIYFGAFCFSFAPDSQTFFTDGPDHTVLRRETKSGAVLQPLSGHSAGITSINSSPAGDKVVSSSFDGTVRLWDIQNGACLAVLQAPGPYAGMNIADVTGISDPQRAALMALGAVEN